MTDSSSGNVLARLVATMTRKPEAFSPLPVHVFYIMVTLVGEVKHGYLIMQDANKLANEDMLVGPASLYRTLKALCDSGLIQETIVQPMSSGNDARRRYYVLTDLGERVLKAERRQMRIILSLLDAKMP